MKDRPEALTDKELITIAQNSDQANQMSVEIIRRWTALIDNHTQMKNELIYLRQKLKNKSQLDEEIRDDLNHIIEEMG